MTIPSISLKTRVLLMVLIIIVAGIWGLAARVAAVLQADIEKLLAEQLSATVGYLAADIDHMFQQRIDTLNQIAAAITPDILADPARIQRLLAQRNESSKAFPIGLFVANKEGIILADYPRVAGRQGGSIGDRNYFRELMASGKVIIGRPIMARNSQRLSVPIAVPLHDASGSTVGIIVGSGFPSDQNLFGQLEQTKIGKTGYLFVSSPKDDLIVSASDKSRILQALPKKGVNPLLDRRRQEGFEGPGISINSRGVEVLTASRNMKTTGWIVLAGVATREVFAPIATLKQQIYLAALLMSLAAILILRFVLNRQLLPLKEAATAMRLMSEGKQAFAPIAVAGEDEIGQLVQNFNRLLADRSRLDEALRGREAQLRLVIDHVPAMIAYYDSDNKCLLANQRYADLYGFTASEVVGMDAHEVTGASLVQKTNPHWKQALAGKAVKFTRRVHRSPNEDQYVEVSLIPDQGEDGPVRGYYGLGVDVTEREQMLQALRASEDRERAKAKELETVLDALPVAVFIAHDAECRSITGNRAAHELVGVPAYANPSKTTSEDECPAYRVLQNGIEALPEELPMQVAAATGARVYGSPWTIVLADGTEHHVLSNAAPLHDAQGKKRGSVGVFVDVTEQIRAEKALKETLLQMKIAHQRLSFQFERLPLAFIVWDRDFRVTEWNPAAEKVFGWSAAEVLGQHAYQLILPRGAQESVGLFPDEADFCANIVGHSVKDSVTKEGKRITCEWFNAPMKDEAGTIVACLSMVNDISERIAAENQLRLAAEVFENSREAIVISDRNNDIVATNRSFSAVTGYSEEEVIGRNPSFLASGHHEKDFHTGMWTSLSDEGHWKGEIWDRRKNGEIYPKWVSISAVKSREGDTLNFVSIFSDISERKASEKRIEFLAHHDVLTGLPNRMLVRDRLQQAMAYADRTKSKVALLFLDLDNFKTINDSLGHSVGDALLKAVAARLSERVRDTDTVSRQGGDEFLIVLTDMPDADAANPVLVKIMEGLQQPFDVDGYEMTTSVSVGVAIYPDDGVDFDTLLKKADMAMYQAKDAGRNAYRFFDEHMNVEAVEHLSMRNGLRRAIEREEFVLHYQPQIDLASGAVVGAEALIRWNHPELGMVQPGRFIAVAEESGLIVPIGEWVLREACRQAVAWQQAGLPELLVAVNLSAIQFKRSDVERTVINALEESGLDPSLLELELTESILIKDTETVLATVKRLKLLGVKLSIDDFGTGYSSLSYLKRFEVDRLKIDQSFIRDLATDPEDAAIVRAIIQMARSLNLRTIAEGVEDERLLEYLRIYHCDEAQGFYFARPMPADAFASYLAGKRIVSLAGLPGSHPVAR